MARVTALFMLLALSLLPEAVLASAFEEHSSWDLEPRLETEKGISLGKAVMEMGMGIRFLKSKNYFNSERRIAEAPVDYSIYTLDIFWRFGFTENWTIWANVPIVWSTELKVEKPRTADMEVGDCETGVLYQFFRRDNPTTLSMGLGLRWKLPTGNEAPGAKNYNITGTGLTDVELFYQGRWQLIKNLSVGWAAGYNIRFPGAVQYLSDNITSISNAYLDLGDEIFGRLEVIGAIELLALQITFEYRYRTPTEVGMPEFRAETIRWTNPITGQAESDTFILYNGTSYKAWDLHRRLDPAAEMVSSDGDLFTITPRIIFRPLDWLDFSFFAKIHFIGFNTIFLTDKDGNNSSFDNFMPMQALGFKVGGAVVVGEVGGYTSIRW